MMNAALQIKAAGQTPMGAPRLSITVPTYNRVDNLRRLIHGLVAQTCPSTEFEVIIVDDGSTDATASFLGSLNPPFALRVIHQSNGGPAAARNRAIQEAVGSIVLFLDDDVIPDPGLVSAHLEAQTRGPRSVVVGPMLAPHGLPRPAWVRWEEDKLAEQYRDLLAGRYACSPRQFYTANASLSRDMLLDAGGFDPAFKRAEDVELAYRLREGGATFVFAPDAKIVHVPSRSFEAWCRTPYQYGRYDVAMHRDKGHDSFICATSEFHERNPLCRFLARICVDRPLITRAAEGVLRRAVQGFDRRATYRVASLALSAIFSIRYWQGAADELGGAPGLWTSVEAARPTNSVEQATYAA
ncbi:MAG: glycosyltransferase family 2 protein [Chloroflexota bacterium]